MVITMGTAVQVILGVLLTGAAELTQGATAVARTTSGKWFIIWSILLQQHCQKSQNVKWSEVINVKIPLQNHKKYDITQYGELDFS